jgi:succinoglycan biosynthesis transport protein ExoP
MQNHDRQNQAAGLSLADIYYILFRHKWKIIGFSAAGFLAAALIYFLQPTVYSSEAKLFIRYVLEARLPSGIGGDPQIKTPDPGGANIINSEIEIMKSLDLAAQVVEAIGPEKIIGKGGGETNKYLAAAILKKSLTIEVPLRSDILRIVFQHPNRAIVQPVLDQLISAYLRKHVDIHRSVGAFDDVLTQQTDALRSQLAQTEADLRKAKTNAGLMSVEDAKKAYTEEISKTRQVLFNTQAELAELQVVLQERQKLMPAPVEVSTNQLDVAVPSAKIEEYKRVSGRLESFRKREQELLTQFTEENSMVQSIREQIASAEKLQKNLEAEYPKLTQIQLSSSQPGAPSRDWSEVAQMTALRITALQTKLKVLNSQLEKLTADAKTVNELEPAITELQRKKDLEETKYRHFSTSLEQARFDEALSAGKMSNISVAQTPTPPYRESKQLVKTLGMIAIGGVVAGFALAFLIELFLDPTVRRPTEVETRLHLPLFLTIPKTRRNGRAALPAPSPKGGAKPTPSEPGDGGGTDTKSEVAPWHANELVSYYEALRDRLVTFFEINNLTRKPKMIAVTGCAKGAGVTTIATGLAASLSETGDGNVLLVDMTTGQGAAHPFFKGKPGHGLADALESGTRDNALVQENLYAVAERSNGGQLPRILPRRFNSLVPKLKASDYDYIIFDMPPVSQISVTPRLAGFMDMVLLVIESEKTDREVVKRATSMLAESKANVSAILNKNRDYVPKRLSQDL